VHVQGWVTPEQAEAIRRIMRERSGEELAEGRRGRERDATNTADWNPTRAPLSHIDAVVTSIHLERREPARNRRRFYAIAVARTLFDQWAVIREQDRVGDGADTTVMKGSACA
jgi:hypothetical protein